MDREQAMRDYKLTIEYKHLKQHCPVGVYLLPSFDDIRLFHGVVFVRRGMFTNGVFKFELRCPLKYNDAGTHPTVKFTSYVYNPHVHPTTGEVDIKREYPRWDSNRHFLTTVLTYVKRIFYTREYQDEDDKYPNQEALKLYKTDLEGFRRRVAECVRESQKGVYLNENGSTIKFTKEEKVHEILRDLMKQRYGANDDKMNADDIARVVTREETLELIKQARSLSMARNSEE
mmetsp:Transcript_11903/g.25110  ORF Transcript_11903/g.25110 Transcript_11903/m.25110 type:complete len:231 (+) Transcript_11903:51-743(+)